MVDEKERAYFVLREIVRRSSVSRLDRLQ